MVLDVTAGTQIGEMDCPSCGANKPLKVNKSGCVYFFCRNPVGERDGKREDCFTRFNWGRVASQKMIEEFKQNSEEITNVREHENREETAEGTTTDERDSTARSGGGGYEREIRTPAAKLGAGLKHFILGDE